MNDDDLARWLSDQVDGASPTASPPFDGVLGRHDRLHRRRRAVAIASASLAVVGVASVAVWAGPGSGPADLPAATTTPTGTTSPTQVARPEPTYTWNDSPPPVVLRLADRDVSLKPWTYCWSGPPNDKGIASGLCADGRPGDPGDLANVGAPKAVDFWFGMKGWDFQATFRELGVACPRSYTVDALATGDHTFRLDPAGLAGRYQVDLFGRGQGDVITSFVWSTPVDGPIEQPEAHLALVTDEDEDYTSYGVELSVSDLALQPRDASATVTVTSAGGRSATFEPRREHAGTDCYEQGSLFFGDRDMDAVAAQVKALGDGPFSYRVVLTIDGKNYVGTAVWPRDEKKDEAPNTVLTFDPPLPAFTG